MRELAMERPRWGWRRLKILFGREGLKVGYDRFLRIYRANGLQVRPRKKRKVQYVRGEAIPPVTRANERWSIRLHARSADQWANVPHDEHRRRLHPRMPRGRRRLLVRKSRRYPRFRGSGIRTRLSGEHSLRQRERVHEPRDAAMGRRAESQVHFIQPGKPTQNAKIESLNGRIRDELLNTRSFVSIFEARRLASEWRDDYNEKRPHSALGYLTPREFARRAKTTDSQLSAA